MSTTRTAPRSLLVTGAVAAALALGLTACGGGGGDATESPSASPSVTAASSAPASSPAPASESPSPSESASGPASASPSASASNSPSASASATPSSPASSIPAAATEATVFWVGPAGHEGGVAFEGCGEVLVEDTVPVAGAGSVGDPALVQAALQALLDERDFDVDGGLMNALYQSELTIRDILIEGDTVTVELSGQPMSAGTCADPQIWAQLETTALTNAGTYQAEILVEGEPIREFMSAKG